MRLALAILAAYLLAGCGGLWRLKIPVPWGDNVELSADYRPRTSVEDQAERKEANDG